MHRARSVIKLFVATSALISASLVSAGNHNTCFQNISSCSYLTASQCATGAVNVGTADSPSWQPCVLNQARAACPTDCAPAANDQPSSTQSTYCATVNTTATSTAAPAYPPCTTSKTTS